MKHALLRKSDPLIPKNYIRYNVYSDNVDASCNWLEHCTDTTLCHNIRYTICYREKFLVISTRMLHNDIFRPLLNTGIF